MKPKAKAVKAWGIENADGSVMPWANKYKHYAMGYREPRSKERVILVLITKAPGKKGKK